MKHIVIGVIFSLVTLIVYLGFGTQWTFDPSWERDYFNLLAQSLRQFRVDIPSPADTYDLVFYDHAWYVLWGVLPSVFIIPFQILSGRYLPPIYISVLFASFNALLVYLLFVRLQKEFLPRMRVIDIFIFTMFFLYGTAHVYVGTLGSVWHVSQIVSSFFGILGVFAVFRRVRRLPDYLISFASCTITILGRQSNILYVLIPLSFYLFDIFLDKTRRKRYQIIVKETILVGILPLMFVILFLFYNWTRFDNLLETGYRYIQEDPALAQERITHGVLSYRHMARNVWYMFFEIPKVSWQHGVWLDINLQGNSIFFLSPPFIALFLTSPWKRFKDMRYYPYITILWITLLSEVFLLSLYYSTGWMQFGYRYSLDFLLPLAMLSVFGIRGRVHMIYVLGIIWSIVMYMTGIILLM